LLRYFGEEIPEDNCGKCDVCLQPRIEVDGTAEARLIIKCIQDLNQRFGMTHVVDVLTGSRAKKITDKKHHLLKSYGQGDAHPKNEWQDMAREMVRQDVIKVEGARYPLLKLNKKSMEVLDGKRAVNFTRKVEGAQTDYEPITKDANEEEFGEEYKSVVHRRISDDPDRILFDKLKELRISLAQMQDVPPYIIFADTSLRQMAARRPTTKEEMLKITGVGEYKLKKYGDMFLKEIAEYLETLEGSNSSTEKSKVKNSVKDEVKTKVSGNKIQKPPLKKEIVLKALDELENDLIKSIKDKLGGTYSDDEIRNVYQSVIKRK
jgi:ATP-dependent DNA helicase RecQ